MSTTVIRKTLAFLAGFAIILGGTVGVASPAHAGASSCGFFGAFGKYAATGTYCGTLGGSGRFVSTVSGSFAAGAPICNYRITAEFFDRYGNHLATRYSGTHVGCFNVGGDVINVNSYWPTGLMCTTLQSNGGRVGSRCFSIY
jgi:hypothetical protein